VEIGINFAIILALGTIILIVALLLQRFPSVVWDESVTSSSKIDTLDGLRGVVALCVVMHHSIIAYMQHARIAPGWVSPVSNFQNQLGSASVSIFFMISAYLFCGKLIRDNGRLDLVRFIEGRILRIVPLYVVLVFLTALFALWSMDFSLKVSPTQFLSSIARVSLFNFVEFSEINTVDVGPLIGQIWTLQFEWLLYAAIPLSALFMRRSGAIWPLFAGLIAGLIYSPLFAFFVAGAAASLLVKLNHPPMMMFWKIGGFIGLIIILLGYHDSRGWPQAVFLTPIFVATLQGNGSFAVLGRRPFRLLGDLSFSIYLLHGFTLWFLCNVVIGVDQFPTLGFFGIFSLLVFSGLFAILFALFGYFLVERPFMRWRPISGTSGFHVAGAATPFQARSVKARPADRHSPQP
jgi:peptidoglycan/LPS O-acetylase OafA/YrhL